MQSRVEHVPTIADVGTRASREEGKILLTENALLTEGWRQDRRTMAMAAGSTSLSSLLVAAHELFTEWPKLDSSDGDSSATLQPWQLKRFRNTSRTSAETVQTLSCGRKKKPRASSRCTMATIALRNRRSRNCRPRLKPWPKRENLLQPKRGNLSQPKRENLPQPKRGNLPQPKRESPPWPKRES